MQNPGDLVFYSHFEGEPHTNSSLFGELVVLRKKDACFDYVLGKAPCSDGNWRFHYARASIFNGLMAIRERYPTVEWACHSTPTPAR
mmetsp:Transcript_8475/g.21083  ORF Transcript_8475/g.21083 Transcript_8475/m.21083 type:complete len:87 (-) Transcript_8475:1063-1323(-)